MTSNEGIEAASDVPATPPPPVSTVEHNGWTVTSTNRTPEQIKENLDIGKPKDEKASERGKKGGEATAAIKRREARDAKKAAQAEQEAPAAQAAEQPARKPAEEQEQESPAEQEAAKEATSDEEPEAEKQETQEEIDARNARARARVEQATREAAELRRQLQATQKEMADLRAKIEGKDAKPAQEQSAPQKQGPPRLEDYDDLNKWADDRDAYNRRQWEEQAEIQRRAEEVGRGYVESVNRLVKQLGPSPEEAKAFYNGLETFAPHLDEMRATAELRHDEPQNAYNWMMDAFLASHSAKPLMRYLNDNPQVFQHIAGLRHPYHVYRAIGHIEGRIEGATTGKPSSEAHPLSKAEPSKAHPPVTPVAGAPVAARKGYRPGMSLDEYSKGWKP